MAAEAHAVARRRGERCQLLRAILCVRIVAAGAAHLLRAAAEQEVAALPGIGGAAAGHGVVPAPALPGPGIGAQEHGMAVRTGPVDAFGARRLRRTRPDCEERALQPETGWDTGVA